MSNAADVAQKPLSAYLTLAERSGEQSPLEHVAGDVPGRSGSLPQGEKQDHSHGVSLAGNIAQEMFSSLSNLCVIDSVLSTPTPLRQKPDKLS